MIDDSSVEDCSKWHARQNL